MHHCAREDGTHHDHVADDKLTDRCLGRAAIFEDCDHGAGRKTTCCGFRVSVVHRTSMLTGQAQMNPQQTPHQVSCDARICCAGDAGSSAYMEHRWLIVTGSAQKYGAWLSASWQQVLGPQTFGNPSAQPHSLTHASPSLGRGDGHTVTTGRRAASATGPSARVGCCTAIVVAAAA